MASYLSDAMHSSYDRYRAEQKLGPDTGLLKSYLIEAHIISAENNSLHDETLAFLKRLAGPAHIHIFESNDETLFNIVHGKDTYYLDVSDPRFWVMHTLALSARADKLRGDLIRMSPFLDSAWLPTQFLEKLTKLGHFRGFGAVHDETPFAADKEGSEVETMHLRLWGGNAGVVLEALRNSNVFSHSLALSSVRVKYWLPNLDEEAIIDNFTHEGKATALGRSFSSHTNLISKLYLDYAQTIRMIEDSLPIRFVPQEGLPTLDGHPIIINLTRRLRDIRSFVSKVFSSNMPFRLWGLSEVQENDFARVYAVDLHVGHKLTFEITRDFVRIYLPPGTCGNTIARFYTNIQQHYDSMASISGGPHEQLF
ncbi:MAG: hypothetical protein NTZ04_02110 [Chloroflexi bacterium]|nr:hypothetical protein [Chloroflexota bacterium]